MGKRGLAGRFRWLLETMMRGQGIDVQELDASLNYWEAKAKIEAKYRTKLVLKLDKLEEKMLEEPPRKCVLGGLGGSAWMRRSSLLNLSCVDWGDHTGHYPILYNANIYYGCQHDCQYCYSKKIYY